MAKTVLCVLKLLYNITGFLLYLDWSHISCAQHHNPVMNEVSTCSRFYNLICGFQRSLKRFGPNFVLPIQLTFQRFQLNVLDVVR